MPPSPRLAYALDYPNTDLARDGAAQVVRHAGVLKVGLELFVRDGHAAVGMAHGLGAEVFLDLKLHDIPATVERAVATAAELGVRYLTLHACGGPKMLSLAAERARKESPSLTLLAVTVLTSMDADDLRAVGVSEDPGAQVDRLARIAIECGVGGLVCSVEEVGRLRHGLGPDPVLVTPGIRPAGAAVGDQKRVGTPAGAITAGSSLLVVGRPIRDAADPALAAERIHDEIDAALASLPAS